MRFHGFRLAEEIRDLILEKCKDSLNLQLVMIGPLESLPAPESLASSVPAVVIEPQYLNLEWESSSSQCGFMFLTTIYFIYKFGENEDPIKEAGEGIEAIAKALQEHEKLGRPDLKGLMVSTVELDRVVYNSGVTRPFWLVYVDFAGMELDFIVRGFMTSQD